MESPRRRCSESEIDSSMTDCFELSVSDIGLEGGLAAMSGWPREGVTLFGHDSARARHGRARRFFLGRWRGNWSWSLSGRIGNLDY